MNTKALRQKILDLAIHGKLVPQDPNDEPASVLLERIRAEKERLIKEGKIKKPKKSKAACDKPHYPFELPKGWAITDIGELLINRDGERKPVSSAIRCKQKDKVYDYYGAAGVIDKVDEYLFDERLLLIGEDGANLLSRSKDNAFFADGKYWVNNHAHVLDATDKSILDFVAIVINSMKLDDFITGSAQPKLSQDNLNKIPVMLPPINEQCRILKEVKLWFSLIALIERGKDNLIETIKQAKSKILDLAIHGKLVPQDPNDEPASELLKRINPKAEITCDNHQYGKLPKGWCETTLKSLAKEVFAGGDKPTEFTKEKTNGNIIPIYANGVEKDGLYGYTNAARVIEPCLTVSARGTIGFTCIRNIPFVPIVRLITIVPNPAFDLKYMKFCLDCLLIWSEGSSIPQLTVPTIKKMQLPLPPLQEQHRIVAKIEELFTQFDKIEEGVS